MSKLYRHESGVLTVTIPVSTTNELNAGNWNWRTRRAYRLKVRTITNLSLLTVPRDLKPKPPLTVTMTRFSAGTLDTGGLWASLKSVEDATAEFLGVDDADPIVTWLVDQKACKRGTHFVEVGFAKREDVK